MYSLLLLISMFGCTSIDESIIWEGYLYEQSTEGMVPLEDSTLELIDENGTVIMEGEIPTLPPFSLPTPHADSRCPRETHRITSIESDNHAHLVVWREPRKSGTWLAGGLFAIESTSGMDF